MLRHGGSDPSGRPEASPTGAVLPPSHDAELPDAEPVVLGDRYELVQVLGRGGMAEVHRATDRLLGRDVAVKVLRDSADSESDRARFIAEARTLAQLSHSGLVMVLDAGITAERPYIVMELVEGPTLAQVISPGPLDLQRAGSVGVQLAEALAYAHDRGVVHRDVKPANVLLGAGERVKLADFGIARLIGDTVRHTQTGQAIGTAAYVAPEQVRGDDVDGAADVYSLGLVLLEALTGERAFPGSVTEAALARLHRPPDVPPTLPEQWQRVLVAMTRLEPRERPSAREVSEQLVTEPTSPIPPAHVQPPGVPVGETTMVLTEPTAVRPVVTSGASGATAPAPAIDRAGDALAGAARRGWARARAMPPHQRGVAAAVAALVLLIVVVAIAGALGGSPGGTTGGSGTGSNGSTGSGSTDLPPNTPTELRGPLRALHDAVEGR